jgi:hypothetical protein
MTALRHKRSVVEIGSRPKRDMLLTPPGASIFGGFALATGFKEIVRLPKMGKPCRPVTGADLQGAPDLVRAPQRLGCDPGPVSVRRMGLSAAASGLRVDLMSRLPRLLSGPRAASEPATAPAQVAQRSRCCPHRLRLSQAVLADFNPRRSSTRWRMMNFCTFPVMVIGNSPTNST